MTTTRIGSADWQAALTGAVAFDLGAARLIAIRGKDVRRFCNGMFTNNIRALAQGQTNRSAMVEDRARIQGFLSLACVADDHFLALLDEGVETQTFLERYERYIVFDEVTLEPQPGLLVSVQGPGARAALEALGFAVPAPGHFVASPLVLPQLRSVGGGFDLVVDEAQRERLLSEIHRVSPEVADALRVVAGRPRFPQDTGDKRLPHELGLRDELLSFDKGCYLGQETINRVDVMGQVKRELTGIRVPGADELPVGAVIWAEGAEVGVLTSAAIVPAGEGSEGVGLAVLKKPADTPGTPLELTAGDRRWKAVAARPPLVPSEKE